MLLFTLILSILASLLASLIPAIRASAVQPIAQLKLL
jgi:putative ABC transport system permease protein